MTDPMTEPPQPLHMTDEDIRRIVDALGGGKYDEHHSGERLLIEILDCLRRIDDKLDDQCLLQMQMRECLRKLADIKQRGVDPLAHYDRP